MMTELSEQECRELLRATTVGRVGFVADDRVQIIPVNYLVDADDVVIRTAPTGLLRALTESTLRVAFEVDHHDDLAGSGWSVLLGGTVSEMTDDELAAVPGASRRSPWAEGDRSLPLRFSPSSISGRRVRRRH
ncbi:pyridoxamine 5'-phosphate oxidase family protein [Microbacterium sp.]|uniref:pyridoxamine 5'-phosphate oxidase family protein n=1 Tax=Microbacterium sp. TaxID=51671 RepID=UPI0028ABE171|nr:pyridoxamine 5'-phosphate oxidase family protein [Microbacterium sp.]